MRWWEFDNELRWGGAGGIRDDMELGTKFWLNIFLEVLMEA
jgi:hypothetical protein